MHYFQKLKKLFPITVLLSIQFRYYLYEGDLDIKMIDLTLSYIFLLVYYQKCIKDLEEDNSFYNESREISLFMENNKKNFTYLYMILSVLSNFGISYLILCFLTMNFTNEKQIWYKIKFLLGKNKVFYRSLKNKKIILKILVSVLIFYFIKKKFILGLIIAFSRSRNKYVIFIEIFSSIFFGIIYSYEFQSISENLSYFFFLFIIYFDKKKFDFYNNGLLGLFLFITVYYQNIPFRDIIFFFQIYFLQVFIIKKTNFKRFDYLLSFIFTIVLIITLIPLIYFAKEKYEFIRILHFLIIILLVISANKLKIKIFCVNVPMFKDKIIMEELDLFRYFIILIILFFQIIFLRDQNFTNCLILSLCLFIDLHKKKKYFFFLLLITQFILTIFDWTGISLPFSEKREFEFSYILQYYFIYQKRKYNNFADFFLDNWIGLFFFYFQIFVFYILIGEQNEKKRHYIKICRRPLFFIQVLLCLFSEFPLDILEISFVYFFLSTTNF